MNTSPTPSESPGRARIVKIAMIAWLLLVSALAVVNNVGLSHVVEPGRDSAQDAQVQALAARIGELDQQVAALGRQPKPVAQPDFDAARQALEERLAQLERAQGVDPHASDLQALQARMEGIEARLKKAPPTASAPPRTAEAIKPKPPEPFFSVVGVELRGGERFLSIATPGAASLRELQLLREGDAIGAWQLQAIEARAAVFRVDGQTLRVALP